MFEAHTDPPKKTPPLSLVPKYKYCKAYLYFGTSTEVQILTQKSMPEGDTRTDAGGGCHAPSLALPPDATFLSFIHPRSQGVASREGERGTFFFFPKKKNLWESLHASSPKKKEERGTFVLVKQVRLY